MNTLLLSCVFFLSPSSSFLLQATKTTDAVKKFEREFRSTAQKPKTPDQRSKALDLLVGIDLPAVAVALSNAYLSVELEILALDERRTAAVEALARMVKGQEFTDRSFETGAMASYKQLRAQVASFDRTIERLHGLEAAILARAGELKETPTLIALIEHAFGDKTLPFHFKRSAVQMGTALGEPLVAPLEKALATCKEPQEAVLLLEGLGTIGRPARSAAERVLGFLSHSDPAVREQAAFALSQMAVPSAISPLIDQLAQEPEGITQKRVAAALEVLTRRPLGSDVEAWKRWYTDEGFKLAAGEGALGGGISSLEKSLMADPKVARGGYYHGIPQDGRSIVYVIDCSGSMVVSATNPRYDGKVPVDAGKESRMEACKAALVGALGKLPSDCRFNIVCFNDLPHLYAAAMQEAKPAEIKKARQWVENLEGASTTNIHDAMQKAFEMAGRGTIDKYYRSAVDTIFLLTDGTPTTTDGEPDSKERVLEALRRWNSTQSVIIHTIGIGKHIDEPFLRQIAREHGGRFVQHFQ